MNIFLRFILFVFFAFAGQSYATTAVAYGYEDNVFQAGVENLNNNGLINPSGCCSNLSARDSQDRAQARPFFAFAADFVVPKGNVKPVNPELNIASEQRTQHILYGDGPNSGGHLWPGQPGKTAFPQDWNADKVMGTISDIATDPKLVWKPQTGSGGMYTKAGDPARFVVTDANGNLPVVDGVPVKVIIEPAGEGIITGFPQY